MAGNCGSVTPDLNPCHRRLTGFHRATPQKRRLYVRAFKIIHLFLAVRNVAAIEATFGSGGRPG
jgi:hypothetical protein